MNFDQIVIISIIALLLFLFIWGRYRYDIVAMIGLFSASIFGLIPSDQMFSGFGHPATITVAIVLILSYGLTKSGAVEGVARVIAPLAKFPTLHITALIFIAAFLSMFMNNIGALALLMPIAISSSVKFGRSPSTILMPLSFGSILGGLVTLIGTPPNIIISQYRSQIVGESFSMFDFAPVGGIVALVGILFMAVIGWRLVIVRKAASPSEMFDIESYLFEVKIRKRSGFIGKTIQQIEEIIGQNDIMLTSLINKQKYIAVPPKDFVLSENDMLILEGGYDEIDKMASKYKLSFLGADSMRNAVAHSEGTIMLEVVIAPGSRLEGRVVEQVRLKSNYQVNLLAISREDKSIRKRLRYTKLKAGDVLLLHGEKDHIKEAVSKIGVYPLAERGIDLGKRRFGLMSLSIFALAIFSSSLGLMDLQISLCIAIFAMIALNILPLRELYEGVDWPVIVLLGAMIPVGNALETTGTTAAIADSLLGFSANLSPFYVLLIVFIITMTLSDILNNATTAIIMAPIAKDIAQALNVSVDPFLIAVAIGASCAFLTPIGHQNNALIMGPGGYRFGDYWRVGLPLEILVIAVATPLILVFWPL